MRTFAEYISSLIEAQGNNDLSKTTYQQLFPEDLFTKTNKKNLTLNLFLHYYKYLLQNLSAEESSIVPLSQLLGQLEVIVQFQQSWLKKAVTVKKLSGRSKEDTQPELQTQGSDNDFPIPKPLNISDDISYPKKFAYFFQIMHTHLYTQALSLRDTQAKESFVSRALFAIISLTILSTVFLSVGLTAPALNQAASFGFLITGAIAAGLLCLSLAIIIPYHKHYQKLTRDSDHPGGNIAVALQKTLTAFFSEKSIKDNVPSALSKLTARLYPDKTVRLSGRVPSVSAFNEDVQKIVKNYSQQTSLGLSEAVSTITHAFFFTQYEPYYRASKPIALPLKLTCADTIDLKKIKIS